ncbi:VWA domain-containing protein [Brevibacillus sp. LEMMJ03]|uniref:IPT/TIG domain-containing protein n=1 Tax=Brevibacillus sp. LEMMJ03 TaxID=2595056 RepID=UPI00117BF13E|nr:IPT/TIG domain-containing protein [Brevibacillus sp. LEMMJ03]TRY24504.1 VWA domain-containing protein [Brevibacillus sp. LEMMJ03]
MQVMKKIALVFFALIVMINGLPTASAATNYVTASKSVNPTSITTEEEAEVTLNITGTPPVNVVKPNDVILIIDRSGSMLQENKMNAAKEAAKQFIDLIDFTKHRVGIVDFSSDARQFDLTTDAAAAKAYIDKLSANGATATGDAIDKARELLANHRPEAQPVIVLMTDGDATVPQGTAYEYALQKANEAKNEGIVFYTIALLLSTDNPDTSGPNLLLKEMATTAHHHHFVLGSVGLAEIYKAIVQEIGMASAYDVVVTDTVSPEFEIVPGSYDNNIPQPTVSGNTLTWNFLELKNDTLTFTYKIRHKQGAAIGTLPTSTKSIINYKDYTGAARYFSILPVNLTVKYPAPVITSVLNDNGHINGGETVTINGDKFRPGVKVTFGTNQATNVQLVNEKQITVTAPPGVQGDTTVTVVNDDGQKASAPYHYYAQPEVTSINPASGPLAGGNTITIYGKYFMPGVTVKFGDASGSVTRYDGYLKVVVPAGTAPGAVNLEIKNPDGTKVDVPNGYTYEAPPVILPKITALSPNSGLVSGNEYVYISGENFASGLKVYFGSYQATVTNYYSATSIKVKTPAVSQAGPVDVKIVNPDGQEATLTNGFTYNPLPPAPAPEVTSASPNNGLMAGGETVYVNGKNFENGLKVYFGSNEATLLSYLSNTQVKVKAPQSTVEGPVDVSVVNPDGQSGVLTGGYIYKAAEIKPAPTITSINPNTGITAGGTAVFITGKDFQTGAKVTFGNKTVNLDYYYDATRVKVKTPVVASAGPVDVTITNPDGQSFTVSQGFTYQDPQVTISSLSPNSGPVTGGTSVYVTGQNFDPNLTVTVDGMQVPIDTYFDSTRFKIKMPSASAVGPVDIVVTNPSGQSATATYTYVEPPSLPVPTLTKLSTTSGPVSGGTYVYIDGTNLEQVKISFGGVVVSPTTILSPTKIKVRVPAASGPGIVDVKAINAEGKESNALPFEYK